MRTLVLGIILVSLMISGCVIFGSQENLTNNSTPPPPPPPPPKPATFSITAPSAGEVVLIPSGTPGNSTDVPLTLSTQNLVLKQPGGSAKKGEGYFRVTIDSAAPVQVTSKTYTMTNLAVGSHHVKVELMNNDKTTYSGVPSKEVTFSIEKEKPKEYVPQSYTVKINGNNYDPANLTVKVKDSVTWVNEGSVPQTATCSVGGKIVFDTKSIGPGKSATVTFTDPVECEYYSQLFRALKGHISVVPNGVD
ncbi:MAG: hypothetical protein U0R44_06615 [Candidatus Micrarchaeia archaeon]